VLLAFPIAYYMARIAAPRTRGILLVAVVMPLWAAYLVKTFAWRTILQGNGIVAWIVSPFGLEGPGLDELPNAWIVLSYLWLPYMILPIYAGLERIPASMLEASADLGARAGATFRRVVLPLVFPALVAGSIFTFSLSLGDYIVPDLVADAKFIGNVIHDNSTLGNLPLASAYSLLPISIMVAYLLLARRLGAFESL
jgi:putative spermidine/putrescine transport system permease protein